MNMKLKLVFSQVSPALKDVAKDFNKKVIDGGLESDTKIVIRLSGRWI